MDNTSPKDPSYTCVLSKRSGGGTDSLMADPLLPGKMATGRGIALSTHKAVRQWDGGKSPPTPSGI